MRVLLAVFFLVCCSLTARAADITAAPRQELAAAVGWCESAFEADVAAIADGGCRFAAAAPGDMARGYSRNAFWLRLELANPGPAAVERLLQIGHPRLEQVSFFEATAAGWRRTDSGLAVPIVRRPLFAVDALLPLRLAPGERRALLVRVASATTIDMTPILWEPMTYHRDTMRFMTAQVMGIGGLLVIAVLSLLIWLRSRNRLYLYFSGTELARAVFMAAFTTLWQTSFWPEDRPLDVRLWIPLGAGGAILLYVPYVRGFVGEFQRNRYAHALLLAMGGLTAVAMLWAILFDYRAAQLLLFSSAVAVATGAFLFMASWRRGNGAAGYMAVANGLFLVIQLVVIVTNFGGAKFSHLTVSLYVWGSLLGAPLVLLGLAVQSEDLRDRLMVAQAESAARVEFLARMSHELRTPLDTILGTAQLLSKPDSRLRLAAGLEDIANSGWRLLRMIDDILDYSRGMSGRLAIVPVPVDWSSFLLRLEHSARLLAERSGNAFTLRADRPTASLRFDEARLRQVLDNLLVNAARHTQSGWIRLECKVGAPDGHGRVRLDFAVADSGEGIAPEDRERIFRPFERVGRRAQQGGKGVGLGLAIARQLVEMMDGRIAVESEVAKGACFRLHVMVDAGEAAPAVDTARPIGCTDRARHILVVEDEADNRDIIAMLLRTHGYAVAEATSGNAAAAYCQSAANPVDLVLTDQFMADGNGWTVLTALAVSRPGVPVVLLSAAPPARPAGLAGTIDFAACLMKPLDHMKLLELVAGLLKLRPSSSPELRAPDATPSLPAAARPAEAELETLRTLIDTGAVSAIVEWAAALVVREPRCVAYAEAVRAAARDLDFPALQALAAKDR
jgi:signal transduction histidine kinase/FixJ family two-component response regulator